MIEFPKIKGEIEAHWEGAVVFTKKTMMPHAKAVSTDIGISRTDSVCILEKKLKDDTDELNMKDARLRNISRMPLGFLV